MHLLVVDDDNRIRTLLTGFLGKNGFRVSAAASAQDARRQLSLVTFDLLILDIMMPGETGLELARSLRETSDVPILMLTARSEPAERIEGLEVGADDYLAKPFEPRELLLRINNILKRGAAAPAPTGAESVQFGPFSFHIDRGELKRDDEVVRITDRERDILRLFASRPGITIRRHEFLDNEGGGERGVDVQINRLRRKLEVDPSNPVYLQTTRGIGYRLLAD
ncbi:response regulator [Faunimonas pinastri]|nr:response regulator transcription factor [Faunimonas pinastri]